MVAKIGATKPTSRISIATNVQAMPVTSTALRWNGERSRARRTSSTSRAPGTAMSAVVMALDQVVAAAGVRASWSTDVIVAPYAMCRYSSASSSSTPSKPQTASRGIRIL